MNIQYAILFLMLVAVALVAWMAIEYDSCHQELTEYRWQEFLRNGPK